MSDGAIAGYRIAGQRALDGKLLDAVGSPGQQCALRRQRARMDRMEASLVHLLEIFNSSRF